MKRSLGKLIEKAGNPPSWGGSPAFQKVSEALKALWAESERFYTQNEQGEYPKLDQAALERLGAAYEAAVQALREYEISPVTGGEKEEKSREGLKRMRALLLEDQQMLGQVDPSKGLTLPEAASNAAAPVVDIGTSKTHYAGEKSLKAIPIQLQAPDGTTKKGYFQQITVPDLNKNGAALFERLSGKYPAFQRLIDQLGGKPLTDAFGEAQGVFLKGLKDSANRLFFCLWARMMGLKRGKSVPWPRRLKNPLDNAKSI